MLRFYVKSSESPEKKKEKILNMYKVEISKKAIWKIDTYIARYVRYYDEMFSDSWILNENQIIQMYIEESRVRYQEIKQILQDKLSNPHISYIKNTVVLRWRSKVLIVSFEDSNNFVRRIIDLEIR